MYSTDLFSQAEPSPFRQTAQVIQQIGPNQLGQIRFQATYWRASFARSNQEAIAKPETMVRVIGRDGLTLIVVPIEMHDTEHYSLNNDRNRSDADS